MQSPSPSEDPRLGPIRTTCKRCSAELTISDSFPSRQASIEAPVVHDEGLLKSAMCCECMNSQLEDLKNEVAARNNDLSKYTEALFELERDRRSTKIAQDANDGRLSLVSHREEQLKQELARLQDEEARLVTELNEIEAEERRLDAEETKLSEDYVGLTRTILDSDESIEAVNRKLQYCQTALKRLKRMKLISQAFFIYGDGPGPASINGLRLARPAASWSEVNAALGFLCLLVDVLIKKTNLTLSQYRLLPRGSYSVLVKRADKSVLELFADEGSGGLTRFLTGRKFDSAMAGFLQVVAELVSHLQRSSPTIRLPHAIEDAEGKIGGLAIGLQFNSEESWTKAMKMLLVDVKYIANLVES